MFCLAQRCDGFSDPGHIARIHDALAKADQGRRPTWINAHSSVVYSFQDRTVLRPTAHGCSSKLLIIRLLKQIASSRGVDPVFAQHLVLC